MSGVKCQVSSVKCQVSSVNYLDAIFVGETRPCPFCLRGGTLSPAKMVVVVRNSSPGPVTVFVLAYLWTPLPTLYFLGAKVLRPDTSEKLSTWKAAAKIYAVRDDSSGTKREKLLYFFRPSIGRRLFLICSSDTSLHQPMKSAVRQHLTV